MKMTTQHYLIENLKYLLDDYQANDFKAGALKDEVIRNVHEQACSAMCMDVYYDELNDRLHYLKSQYL